MSMFDNMGKKLGLVAETTGNKVKGISEVVRLNACIASEESKMDEAYIEIGKLVYEQIKNQPAGPLTELCEKIQKSKGKIESYKAKREQIKKS